MKEEWNVSRQDLMEVCNLVFEYIREGGSGFDADRLERAYMAFMWADRIKIVTEGEEE